MGAHEKPESTDSTTNELHVDALKKASTTPTVFSIVKDAVTVGPSSSAPKIWTVGTIDRVVRTVVQATVGYITAIQLHPIGGFDLYQFLGVVLGAAVISVGTALIAAPSFNNSWWYQIIERAVKTFCQVFVSGIVTTSIAGVAFLIVPTGVMAVLSASGIAALTSVLNSIVSMNVGSPSAVDLVVPSDVKNLPKKS